MSVLNYDPLYPIFDKNRDEIFLVEYENFIKNIVEGIVVNMLLTRQRWINKYPNLKEFNNFFDGFLYDKILLYNSPLECLKELSNNTLDDDEILKDIKEIEGISNTLQFQQSTLLEFVLLTLIKEKFIKKIIFIKSTEFDENELKYLMNIFNDNMNKIDIFSGPSEEVFESHKPTTCFINSLDTINKCINIANINSMKDRLFILRNTNDNIYYNNEDKIFHYKKDFLDKIEVINNSKVYYISCMYSYRQETLDTKESSG
jgi:hypothetical protein